MLATRTLLAVLSSAICWAQQVPPAARQGDAVRVPGIANAVSARLGDRTIKLFPQASGPALGLMPIPALLKPGPYTLEWLDAQNRLVHSQPLTVRDARFPKQNLTVTREIATLTAAPGETELVNAFRETVTPDRLWQEPLTLPVPGCQTSPFGVQRLHNGKPTGNYHSGLDQRGPQGQPVRAVAAGTIRLSRMLRLPGGTVGVDHGQGLSSIYLHLSRLGPPEGTKVAQGDVIGYVGSTGRSTAPHLHWSLYANAVPVNPTQWITIKPCRK